MHWCSDSHLGTLFMLKTIFVFISWTVALPILKSMSHFPWQYLVALFALKLVSLVLVFEAWSYLLFSARNRKRIEYIWLHYQILKHLYIYLLICQVRLPDPYGFPYYTFNLGSVWLPITHLIFQSLFHWWLSDCAAAVAHILGHLLHSCGLFDDSN